MPLPTRRLMGVFGADLEALDSSVLNRLVGQTEDSDLDFKAQMYGNRDADRIEAASDVVSFANLGGGVIVVGVEETDGSATSLDPWAATETDELRIREIVTERVVPYIDVSILRIPSDDGNGWFLLIAIPASIDAPHGVRQGVSLRFPVRDGRRTRYMTEAELAATYRRRFVAFEDREHRLEAVQVAGILHLPENDGSPRPWLTIAAALTLDAATRGAVESEFREAVRLGCPNTPFTGQAFLQSRVGVREVLITDSNTFADPPHSAFAALHADGSAFVAAAFWSGGNNFVAQPSEFQIARDFLTTYVIGLLDIACKHALAAGGGGDAIVSMDIVVPGGDLGRNMVLVNAGNFPPPASGWPLLSSTFAASRYTVPLHAVTDSGPELVAAAFNILTDLEAGFGQPEPRFVRRDGSIVLTNGPMNIGAWAEQRGVPTA